MLDIKLLREHFDDVKARMATRNLTVDWEAFVSLDRERRDALANIEKLKERKNRLSGEIGRLKKSGADAGALMREVEEISDAIKQGEKPLADLERRFEGFMLSLPNLPHQSVTVGKTSDENKVVRRWGEP
ncbi:MAG TPA: serine--tRNA ligase, partial [Candidatus Binatia bacterium]|nr:serine--tRNA ligase [Candidatus Binatia bacterium]